MWANILHTVHCYTARVGGVGRTVRRGCRRSRGAKEREREREKVMKKGLKSATGLAERCQNGARGVRRGWKGLNGGRKGVDSRTNKTLAASFLPVWPDTDPLCARASVLRSTPPLRDGPAPLPLVDAPRRTGLSARYFSSSLINGSESKNASRNGSEWD